jgi:hypothetical protein
MRLIGEQVVVLWPEGREAEARLRTSGAVINCDGHHKMSDLGAAQAPHASGSFTVRVLVIVRDYGT